MKYRRLTTDPISEVEQAVVLAGGTGVRLRPLTNDIPKPMAPVNGRPFLDYLLQTLLDVGIRRVLLLVGYKHERIIERYEASEGIPMEIDFSVGTADDETGTRILKAFNKLDNRFLLMYGDNYWPIELPKMKANLQRTGIGALVTVFGNRRGSGEYGPGNNVEVDSDGIVRRYDQSRGSPGLNGVNIGYFLVDKAMLDPSIEGNLSFEQDLFADWVEQGVVAAHVTEEQYYYITSMETLGAFENHAKEAGLAALMVG